MTSLRVLFVCTGNICRSPSAQYLLRAELERRLKDNAKKIELCSAGTGTPGGWEIDPTVGHLLEMAGVVGSQEFRSRRLDASILAEADLILTGTKEHRLTIGADFPDAYSRTFTMREAANLLTSADGLHLPTYDVVERGRAVVAGLQQRRGSRLLPDEELDITDPHRRRTAAYHVMFAQVQSVVGVLAFVLAPMTARRF